MKALLAAALASCLVFPSAALAATSWSTEGSDRAPAQLFSRGTLERVIAAEIAEERRSEARALGSGDPVQALPDQPKQRSWIRRHPALFGSLVGFGAGFAIGWAGGEPGARGDPSSDYFTPEEAGLLVGGIGAGAGALVGWAIGR